MVTVRKTFFKRMFSIILAFLMIFAYVSNSDLSFKVHALANWIDSADTSWYDGHETDSSFTIGTAEDLAGLAYLVNGGNKFTDKTINLSSDINLLGSEWTPIGTNSNAFCGTFEGDGHTVSNLTITTSAIINLGLFGYVGTSTILSAKINNVKLQGVSINSATPAVRAGSLVGFLSGTVTGCSAQGTIQCSDNPMAGGLIGRINPGTVTDCYANVNIIGGQSTGTGMSATSNLGGLIGFIANSNNSLIDNCYATGNIVGGNNANSGGLIGTARYGTVTTRNCYATGNVTTGSVITNSAVATVLL